MNSDKGIVTDLQDGLPEQREAEIRKLLGEADPEAIETFIEAIETDVAMYATHRRARVEIPDAKDQERYLAKLQNKLDRLEKVVLEVSDLLEEAPFELRQSAISAKAPLEQVQHDLVSLFHALNEVEPSKSKYHPETTQLVLDIAEHFEKAFHTTPLVKAFREESDIPTTAPLGERFIPVLSKLLNLQVDTAYRLARNAL